MNYLMLFVFLFITVCCCSGAKDKKLQCFLCESDYGGLCTDGFHSTGVGVVNCNGSCVKSLYRVTVGDVQYRGFSRYCRQDRVSPNCEVKDEYLNEGKDHIETTFCYCNTHLCNSQTAVSQSVWTMLASMVLWCVLQRK